MVEDNRILLKYEHLNDAGFIGALKDLVNFKTDDFTLVYKLEKILGKVESDSAKAGNEWAKLLKNVELVEVEENGKKTKKPKDEAAYEKLMAEFVATPCTVGNYFKVHFNEIIGYKMSAADMRALKPILTGYEVLEKGPEDGKTN